ncbi:MAG: tripartite tricarboxylate transporter substrate-binding protein [Sulfurospirillaceae bacterium]|nr:tripartite tricarboxylate transporter substrate-binding protein [Sulfurospirillaceae bacterium]MDD2825340.1 tripartite tricarboxylate transporter substrate-binding protein [Sulfurospirillaceae bacterium]
MLYSQKLSRHFFGLTSVVSCLLLIVLSTFLRAEESYPNKPIEMIVGFGAGGSTDTLARSMAPYLSKILNVPIHVRNIPGRGSAAAIEAFLQTTNDGYTILCSAFSPFFLEAILREGNHFTISDLDYLNIQSYGFDVVAVNGESPIATLSELLLALKESTKTLKIAVVENSNGYFLLRLMMEAMNIPISTIELHRFDSDYAARQAIVNGEMDVIFVSSKGAELIRGFITPLAINAQERQLEWDIPTVNEALTPLGFQIPHVPDYMRGFAVQQSLKDLYPERYDKLHDAFMLLMAKKSVQRDLKANKVGGTWTGPENSTQMLNDAFVIFQKYNYLLEK